MVGVLCGVLDGVLGVNVSVGMGLYVTVIMGVDVSEKDVDVGEACTVGDGVL